ncbi:hypothetical protein V1508DRAFT_425903 [Lipomyces doorenjongii]|uniref:uncharacterized protein n=1 Tax=Lipomyces doorenjongii TaxID=383834 RepID=UPI0034CDB4C9
MDLYLIREDPAKGDMHNRRLINMSQLCYPFSDYCIRLIYIIGSPEVIKFCI